MGEKTRVNAERRCPSLAVASAFVAMVLLLAAPAAARADAFQQTLWNTYCANLDGRRQEGCGRYWSCASARVWTGAQPTTTTTVGAYKNTYPV
jgi:hypothetical protein